jgi:hypothetical protein
MKTRLEFSEKIGFDGEFCDLIGERGWSVRRWWGGGKSGGNVSERKIKLQEQEVELNTRYRKR